MLSNLIYIKHFKSFLVRTYNTFLFCFSLVFIGTYYRINVESSPSISVIEFYSVVLRPLLIRYPVPTDKHFIHFQFSKHCKQLVNELFMPAFVPVSLFH
jgi:hypothetical protein